MLGWLMLFFFLSKTQNIFVLYEKMLNVVLAAQLVVLMTVTLFKHLSTQISHISFLHFHSYVAFSASLMSFNAFTRRPEKKKIFFFSFKHTYSSCFYWKISSRFHLLWHFFFLIHSQTLVNVYVCKTFFFCLIERHFDSSIESFCDAGLFFCFRFTVRTSYMYFSKVYREKCNSMKLPVSKKPKWPKIFSHEWNVRVLFQIENCQMWKYVDHSIAWIMVSKFESALTLVFFYCRNFQFLFTQSQE